MKLRIAAALGLTLLVLAPRPAHADGAVIPFIGVNFGGDTGGLSEDDTKVAYGFAVDFVGGAGFGFQIDLGYTPNFFTDDEDFVGDNNALSLMANLLLEPPAGSVRPYASGGVGLLRTHVKSAGAFLDDIEDNDFGLNLGAGLKGYFSDNVGLRADVRYFRSLQEDEGEPGFDVDIADLDFWRTTVGLSIAWGRD